MTAIDADAAIPRTVAVIQARMGSTRLPGKVIEPIRGIPVLAWTIAAVRAVPGVSEVVVATTRERADDQLVEIARDLGVGAHRGSTDDVLARCWDAVAPYEPDIVLRQTADNPFPDPAVAADQLRRLVDDGYDYVGIAGWPHGIAAEVVRTAALEAAVAEANLEDEREHVTLFVRRRPERFRIAPARDGGGIRPGGRFTVDTAEDLAAARRLADAVGHGPPIRLAELDAAIAADPTIAGLNRRVVQNPLTDDPTADSDRGA